MFGSFLELTKSMLESECGLHEFYNWMSIFETSL